MSVDNPVTVLSEDESWSLLSTVSLGRLVTVRGTRAEIFPINFATQRRTLIFRTAQGTKLYNAVMGEGVAFEADDHTDTEGWSVIVHGRAHLLTSNDDVLDAEETELQPWPATWKPHYVRVIPTEISGRRFKFGPQPTGPLAISEHA
ncbi:pyridoxamine 5'-phosphate oxidase [Mycobacterium intermedium]|uniref:Pyridoxamine 5'-phosphate oxidase n=1 Tax=Mycobacterium intermedium TaxID=28445 RepID=A0A1E3SHL0_MYCIE|nr:pyridoxamine 5'-phosphate oxidase family protein [Mycobacterium intermedium]MCV6963355.1 pyridoxamine 5'-phosphate oxidase family protein [Mycobacterium intermedium]ODR01562.1 pyridoxamine 5'-phosphate oxidase [Mycobacterium intermedium]OPE50272.1 pyridoxamine 5'-phosphate oxidase [Mycobacterium intermedium]ORA93390.1 pyridoxamine 5'-phosphate oxidase [Mycobacterium intermedium]